MKNMNMRDMKRVLSDDYPVGETCCGHGEKKRTREYPYSMNINLDNADLDKLGINVSNMATGDMMYLHAEVEVKSLEEREHDGETKQSMTIQMQKMDLTPKSDMKMNEAKKEY